VVNQRTCRRVAREVPYTVTRCVPRCVERQVAFEQCYYVPETVCPTTACATGGCVGGGCSVAPDASSPQPIPQGTEKPIAPVPQNEGVPSSDPKPGVSA